MSDDYYDLLESYIERRIMRDMAERAFRQSEEKLVAWMEEHRRKSVRLDDGEHIFSATYKQATRTEINEQGLRKALGAPTYDKYTVRALDKKALDKAITDGEISSMTVAPFVTRTTGNPYLQYTTKEKSGDGSVE